VARQGSWRGELLGGFAVVAICTLLGGLFQQAVLGFALANVGILLYWSWHLRMVQRWLDRPLEDPPTGRGVWGHLLDSIFRLQRQNREAQSRLESALDYLQDSLASMRDGGIIVNNRGGIAWANASADYLLGIRFPEDRGQSLLNLVRMPEFQSYYESEDFTHPLRVTNVSEDERSLQFEITRFGAGDRLVFVRDITDTVRLEQMRRDFVGDVSHELRTPLTVLKGYIDTLTDLEVFSARQYSKPLEQMQQQAARMENLLRDLLWLSKIETFESHRKTERVNIGSVLSEMVGELRAAYPERTVALKIEGDTTIIGDEPELRSAFSNLIVNALKYSDKEVAVVWHAGADVSEFSVVDQGSGIAAKHIPRLTERFYRVDKSRSQNSGGTGLGLAIVKHVAAAHQAELVIESELGRGSRFGVRFYSARKGRP
jgi:two-component system phosphate regulon sensor histidine kinase PhoR